MNNPKNLPPHIIEMISWYDEKTLEQMLSVAERARERFLDRHAKDQFSVWDPQVVNGPADIRTAISNWTEYRNLPLTQEQLDLQAHILAQNAKIEARAVAEKWTFLALPVDDPRHWAGQGIYNIEQYETEMLRSSFSDSYKDENGIRPNLANWSLEQMNDWFSRRRQQ